MNRLGRATSPYLQQHRDNPVDWWEWSEDAFEDAKRRDVPLLVSIGYSACHWCHVMAHESFEDPVVGAIINENFVAIKVDREERPDVDAVYMQATQAMTGQGGWPMTVFATPDGQPFFCGTYFPRDRFVTLLQSVSQAWLTQRAAVLEQGAQVVAAIAGTPLTGGAEITADLLNQATTQVAKAYDSVHGGFGGAPKFPPHMVLLFLLRQSERTGNPETLEMARHTAEAMARGGLYDQVGGGFHRYTVDGSWTVPHFEKMLYDNALLLRVYTELWRVTGDQIAERIARETAEFMLRDLLTAEGGFASALDADTDGEEGLTYAWNKDQFSMVCGEADGQWAADLFGVTDAGTFEHGLSVLVLKRDIDDPNADRTHRWADVKRRLKLARDARPQPQRDDKVVAAWNGLAITALAEYGRLAGDTEIQAAATKAGELLRGVHVRDGRILRVSRDGIAGDPPGVLEDYGCVAEAFCALHQVTRDGSWLEVAGGLLDTAVDRFAAANGGYYDTADDAQKLVTRPADPTDNATPSGLSSLAAALITYSALSGRTRYRELAEAALGTVTALLAKHPRFAGYSAAAAEAVVSGPVEIAIVSDPSRHAPMDAEQRPTTSGALPGDQPASMGAEPATGGGVASMGAEQGGAAELVAVALRMAPGGAVIVVGGPDEPGVPLLAHRPLVNGQATAYVCRGFVCDRPVTTTVELATMLRLSA